MDTMKEFEIRLFDADGALLLLVPLIVESAGVAEAKAAALQQAHTAARYEVRGLMRSARYSGAAGMLRRGSGTKS